MKHPLRYLSLALSASFCPIMAQQEASVAWEMVQATDAAPTINGPLLSSDLLIEGGKNYGFSATDAVFTSPASMAIANLQNTTTLEEDPGYYIQYCVTPKSGITFQAQEISFYICGKGGGNVRANFYYSKDAGFLTKTQMAYRQNTDLTRDNAAGFELAQVAVNETLAFGDTLYFRIYPYYKSVTTGKYICPRQVSIKGITTGETAVDPAVVVSQDEATFISTTSARFGGSVTSDGGGQLFQRGVVWNTTGTPTIADQKSDEGTLVGSFESVLTGLTPGSTYFARTYATNKNGTSYGSEISFTTLSQLTYPKTTTPTASKYTNLSATLSYQVSSWGGTDITECGIVYSVSAVEPSLENATKLKTGAALGKFTAFISGLQPQTTYYVRSYAINATGVGYSTNVCRFTTRATEPDVVKVIDLNGNGDYTSVEDAFSAVPSGYTGRWILRIKPGIYDERVTLASDKMNVWLLGEDAATTIITGNASAGTLNEAGLPLGTNGSMTVAIDGDDFVASNVTFRNTFVNSKENIAINTSTQAVALRTKGDRHSYYNCRIEGFHDTYYANSEGRAYFKDCYIAGNVDFIFGNSTVVFDRCELYSNRNESVVTAPSTSVNTKFGFVFLDCRLTSLAQGVCDFNEVPFQHFYLGRPWQGQPKSAFIRCEIPATLHAKGWTTMNGGLSPVFVEQGSTGAGATEANFLQRANEGKIISEEAAAAYTIANVFAKESSLSFYSDWIPAASLPSDLPTNLSQVTQALTAVYAYPNPFEQQFQVTFTVSNRTAGKDLLSMKLKITNVNGVTVMEQPISYVQEGMNRVTVHGEALPAGIYFYTLEGNGMPQTGRILKK